MTADRYGTWLAVWEWFQNIDRRAAVSREEWDALYDLLNRLYLDERKDAKPDELAAHAGLMRRLKA